MRRRVRFLLIALLLHLPLFAYPILRLCDWLGLDGWTTTAIFVPLFFKLFTDRQITVPPNLIPYLLSRMPRSIAAARALVADLDARALAAGRPITRALAGEVLG